MAVNRDRPHQNDICASALYRHWAFSWSRIQSHFWPETSC